MKGFAPRMLAVAVAVLFLVAFTSPALAKVTLHSLKGEITSVDTTAKTLSVKEKKGEATISTDEMTKFTMGKEKKAFDDLKTGEKVKVSYHKENGKLVANKIVIKGSHTKKMGKAPGKAPEEQK